MRLSILPKCRKYRESIVHRPTGVHKADGGHKSLDYGTMMEGTGTLMSHYTLEEHSERRTYSSPELQVPGYWVRFGEAELACRGRISSELCLSKLWATPVHSSTVIRIRKWCR